jgi:enoyl-CoA hydratase
MRAKELSLTGNFLDAATAERWGLVNRVVPAEELLAATQELARDICATDRATRDQIRHLIDAGFHATLGEGLELEAAASARHMSRAVSPEKVRARRVAVQQRGRAQQKN